MTRLRNRHPPAAARPVPPSPALRERVTPPVIPSVLSETRTRGVLPMLHGASVRRSGMDDQAAVLQTDASTTSAVSAAAKRRLPIGAEPQSQGGVHFRLWAPRCRDIAVEIEGLPSTPLTDRKS